MNLDRMIEEDFNNQATAAVMQNRLLTNGSSGSDSISVKRIADGAAEDMSLNHNTKMRPQGRLDEGNTLLLKNGDIDNNGNGDATLLTKYNSNSNTDIATAFQDVELNKPLSCYICRKPYVKLHVFYSLLCPQCAEFNYCKREETADLTGR